MFFVVRLANNRLALLLDLHFSQHFSISTIQQVNNLVLMNPGVGLYHFLHTCGEGTRTLFQGEEKTRR